MLFLLLITVASYTLQALSVSLNAGRAPSFNFTVIPTQKPHTTITDILCDDLKSTSFFAEHAAVIENVAYPNPPQFNLWSANKTHYVVSANVTQSEKNTFDVSYKVWDILGRQVLFSGALQTEEKFLRRTSHIIADRIHEQVTGLPSCFDTQITFIHEEQQGNKIIKRLAIMDQDGHNCRLLTPPNLHVLAPVFAPDPRYICFTSFRKGMAMAYIFDLETGKVQFLTDFPGISYAPRFSPDGKKLIFSGAREAASNIFTYDINSKKINQLTTTNLTETSPCYSPDGESIVFTAGQNSTPHLFIMDKYGKNRKQITFSKGGYSAPAWSPDGRTIAFTKYYKGRAYLGVILPDGSGERLITEGYMIAGPQWSPDGQSIVFCRKEKRSGKQINSSKICCIDLTGHKERTIKTIKFGSDPSWSTRLPVQTKE